MDTQWLYKAINEKLEETATRSLEGVLVALLDTGVDATHPDIKGRIIEAYRVESKDDAYELTGCDIASNNDAFGHGTAVAGIISKIAPNTNIIDIRILDSENKGSGAALIEGLSFAINKGARLINMSLAAKARFSPQLFNLTETAYQNNQIIVAAKRNLPFPDWGLPAEFSSVISVDNEDLPNFFNFFYKPNHLIEYAAKGQSVVAPAPGGGYKSQTGTSFATPVITGICSLLVGACPDIKPFEIKTILKALSFQPELDETNG